MSNKNELVKANEDYAATFTKGDLKAPPARGFAVVTCMDARFHPAEYLGFEDGDAHVIRNAGGLVTDDALRSLAISHWELGTREVFVIAHTECGLLTFRNEDLRRKLKEKANADASEVDFLPFDDLDESVRTSVRRVQESPLLPEEFGAHGFVYDVHTGRLREVTQS